MRIPMKPLNSPQKVVPSNFTEGSWGFGEVRWLCPRSPCWGTFHTVRESLLILGSWTREEGEEAGETRGRAEEGEGLNSQERRGVREGVDTASSVWVSRGGPAPSPVHLLGASCVSPVLIREGTSKAPPKSRDSMPVQPTSWEHCENLVILQGPRASFTKHSVLRTCHRC